jgi:BlaI family penicillinase repressor
MKASLRISPAERDVLAVLWRRAPMSTAEIVEALASSKGWSRGTTRTLLARLVRKKAVGCRSDGHRGWYRPLIAEDTCVRDESRTFLERVFSGSSADMLLTLVEETKLTPEQIQRFRDILDRKEN